MTRAEVINMSEENIPENSLAISAAEAILDDGRREIIELFDEGEFNFRGLPAHLGDLSIRVASRPSQHAYPFEHRAPFSEDQLRTLFEYAIGTAQQLPEGMEAVYSDESHDPRSKYYKPFR